MKNRIQILSIVLFFTFNFAPANEPEGVTPAPPETKIPPDKYTESEIGFRIHPAIEKAISKDGEWPIYYIVNLIPARTENYKYLYLSLGIFDGHFGHFGLIVRDKIENVDWEEIEILNSTPEIVKGLKKHRLGHRLKNGDIDIDLMWTNQIKTNQEYNQSLEEIPSTSR